MEYNRKENEAKILTQNVNVLQKKLNVKIKINFSEGERTALKELQRDDKLRVHKFDKGFGFSIVTNDTAKEKIEEQLESKQKPK